LTKYRVLLSQTVVSQLKLLESKQRGRIKESLRNLEESPFQNRSGPDIKRLVTHDEPPLFRIRIGDYRAIYFVVSDEVRVTEIIHRSRGYRWLE
jgi:mRNA interferase RelE/StbE